MPLRSAAGTWRVTATYVGTVVGAGFASGQEILRFFGAYGLRGLWGILLAAGLLSGFGIAVMAMGRETRARSHREVLVQALGPLAGLADGILTALVLAGFGVMVAAGGAIAAGYAHLPYSLGAGAMAGLTALTVLAGLEGVTAANGAVVPLLILAVAGVAGFTLLREGLPSFPGGAPGAPAPGLPAPGFPAPGAPAPGIPVLPTSGPPGAAPHWLLAALLYASYNLLLALPVLAPLGAETGDARALAAGGLLGGAALGLLAAGLHLALATAPAAARGEVPTLLLSRALPAPAPALYTLVLWAEVYTTAVACAFGAVRRLSQGGNRAGAMLLAAALALLLSRVGFSRLVARLYPAIGYGGLLLLARIAYLRLRRGR